MSIVLNGDVLTAVKGRDCAEITAVNKNIAGFAATEEVAASFCRVVAVCHLDEDLSVCAYKHNLRAVFGYVDAKTGELRTELIIDCKLIGVVNNSVEQRHRQGDYRRLLNVRLYHLGIFVAIEEIHLSFTRLHVILFAGAIFYGERLTIVGNVERYHTIGQCA